MAGDMKVSLYTTDPNLVSEIEYLDWVAENGELEGPSEGGQVVSLFYDKYLLNSSQAKGLVSQYRSGYNLFNLKFSDVSRLPLQEAVEEIGLDQLHEYRLHEIYNIQSQDFNIEGISMVLDGSGFTGSSLYKLSAFFRALDSKNLNRDKFSDYITQLVQYDLLDSAAIYIQNNWERDFHFRISGSGIDDKRPLNEEDLKGGLKVQIALADFAVYLERHSTISLETIKKIYPPFAVIDTKYDIVSGRVQVGVEPSAIKASTGAGYLFNTNSICLKTLVDDPHYGIRDVRNPDGSITSYLITPLQSTAVHEMVHAWQDKISLDGPAKVHAEREAEAWNVQQLYDLFLKGETEFDNLTADIKKIADDKEDRLIVFFNKISPVTGAGIFMDNFEATAHGLSSRVWAKEFAAILKRGEYPSVEDMQRMNLRSTQGFANANLTSHLFGLRTNKSIFESIKVVKAMRDQDNIKLTHLDEKGRSKVRGVKIRTREDREEWFNENKPKAEKALDYLDTLTLRGSDREIKKNLKLYALTLLVVIGVENLEPKPDKQLVSDLAKHFIIVSYRQSNQATRTPEKDRGI